MYINIYIYIIQSRFECLRRYSEFHALRNHQATDRYYSIFIINLSMSTFGKQVRAFVQAFSFLNE